MHSGLGFDFWESNLDKNKKFRELAEKRVTRLINNLRLIGNLANRNNYSYTEDEAQKSGWRKSKI